MEKKIKKVCKCEKCGNESEMTITCTLPEADDEKSVSGSLKPDDPRSKMHVKGTAACSHCGNEAEMWIDLEV